MAQVRFFYVNGCPYCAQARKAREELISENPEYGKVEFEEGVDVEAAVLVVAVEFFVLRFGFGSVNQPFFDEILRP